MCCNTDDYKAHILHVFAEVAGFVILFLALSRHDYLI